MKKIAGFRWLFAMVVLIAGCKKNKPEQVLPALGTCTDVAPVAGLVVHKEGLYEYNSGKGTVIKLNFSIEDGRHQSTVTITFKEKSTYQLWGDYPTAIGAALHENLNGKHIKDRIGNNRTVIIPDGTKITLVSAGPSDPITAFTIYNASNVYHVNVTCRRLEYSASNQQVAELLDEVQADGETSVFEETETHVLFYNIYNEEESGNKVLQRVELGSLPKSDSTHVNDLYDDPRLAHT